MQFKPEECNTIDAWIVGSKTKTEKVFFHQIVYKLQHKQRLWQNFIACDMDYFFMEIKLPCTLNTDSVPF